MRSFTRAGLFAGAIALGTFSSTSLHSSTDSVGAKLYLLKVSNVTAATQLVESVGGNVTETAASISYLGAALTDEQLQLLSRSGLIVRIDDQPSIDVDKVAGNWWWRGGRNAIAGNWWWRGGRNGHV